MDPLNKTKLQDDVSGGVAPSSTSPSMGVNPVADEPVTPSVTGMGSSDDTGMPSPTASAVPQMPVGQVETSVPEVSAPPAPPVESTEPVMGGTPAAEGMASVTGEEPKVSEIGVQDETPASSLGQVQPVSEPDSSEGTGGGTGTGLAGE